MSSLGGPITLLLDELSAGEPHAFEKLTRAVYEGVRSRAGRQMRRRYGPVLAGLTLQPTALANDVLLELERQRVKPRNEGHFFAVATLLMIRLLKDYDDRRRAAKRGGGRARVPIDDRLAGLIAAPPTDARDGIARIHDAFRRLHERSPRIAEIATLRLHAGFTPPQIAAALGVSESSVARGWREAKRILSQELGRPEGAMGHDGGETADERA